MTPDLIPKRRTNMPTLRWLSLYGSRTRNSSETGAATFFSMI